MSDRSIRVGGVAEAQFAPLVRAVTRDEVSSTELRERFALAAWTSIAEPGDRDAGRLTQVLGAARAWEVVLAETDPDDVVAEVADVESGGGGSGGNGSGGNSSGVEADADRWTEAFKRWRPRIGPSAALLALRQASRFGMRLLVPGDDAWPSQLDDLQTHAPFALWVRGDVGSLAALGRSVSLVGARAATGYGEHVTIELASGLADRGFAVVSGAAYGVDGAAHRATLASRGVTVAVLAGGLDRYYPSGHEQLITRITQRGAVVAEVPPGTTPTKWRFLLRNRLIAALSNATVVVEAGWRSGSLNTAGHAGTLGRPLGAVPGPVTSAASAGCHRLLREYAAVCVTDADEIAELAGVGTGVAEPDRDVIAASDPSGSRVRVLDALDARTPRRVQRICELTGLAPDRVRATLGLLELEGYALERPSGWMRPKPRSESP